MSLRIRRLLCLLLVAAFAVPTTVFATNGLFLIGYGAKSRAMGGVGIGYTQDSIGYSMNPAGIVYVAPSRTAVVDADLMYFVPIRRATVPDPRDPPNAGNQIEYKSGSNQFLIPAMAGKYKFNRKMSIGFSFVGAGGGNTRYERLSPIGRNFLNPAGRDDVSETLGVSYLQGQMSAGVAYKLNKTNAIGASGVVGMGQFRAYGLGLFKPFSSDPDNLTGRGNDYHYGFGVRLGWQGKPAKWLTLGAVYQSRIYMTKLDKYAGLFGEHGSFDSPENFGLGLSINMTKNFLVAFDVQHVKYSDVKAIGSPISNLGLANGAGFLGENDSAGFGWEDQTVYKLGLKYAYNPKLDLSLGMNYGKVPMPDEQLLFSTLAPAVTEWHLGAGISYKQTKNFEWTLTYVHAFKNKVEGKAESNGLFDNFFPNSTQTGPGDMALEMYQNSIELGLGYKL